MSEPIASTTGPLERELRLLRRKARSSMSSEAFAGMEACNERMRAQADCPTGLVVGDSAPDFILSEAWGAQFWLKESLKRGPTIVIFYRGTWCSFCEATLSAWQRCFVEYHTQGTQVVAISPQYPEATGEIVKRLGLEFPVLCDPGNRVARKFSVVYRQESGVDLRHCNKDCSQELPLPGTFAIAKNSKILYAHVDVDYTIRAEPSKVFSALIEGGRNGLG